MNKGFDVFDESGKYVGRIEPSEVGGLEGMAMLAIVPLLLGFEFVHPRLFRVVRRITGNTKVSYDDTWLIGISFWIVVLACAAGMIALLYLIPTLLLAVSSNPWGTCYTVIVVSIALSIVVWLKRNR